MLRASAFAAILTFGLLAGAQQTRAQAGPTLQSAPVPAPPGQRCFNPYEQRMFVHEGRAIRLGLAMRALHPHDGDELLRAELCRNSSGLVYVLTLLSRNGKVSRVVVDARSGAVIRGR